MRNLAIVKWLNNISIKRKLYFTVGIMGLLIITELLTLVFAINTLSSVRAYVQGEGLYSKAQKDAVYHLLKYAQSYDENDYDSFKSFMKVLEGDRKARIELYKKNPDVSVARQGLIEGRNHPSDIDGMISLFSRFNEISYINKALKIWNEADSVSAALIPIAEEIQKEVVSVGRSRQKIEQLTYQIHPINLKLTILEDNFSYTLGEGSRWLENLIFSILFFIALTVEATGLLLAVFISRGMSRGTKEIINAANAVSSGQYNYKAKVFSKDEIGRIATAFNDMIDSVEQSRKAQKEAEKKQMEFDILRRADRKFRIALEAAPSALLMLDQQGEIILVNKQTEILFGYKRTELTGRNVMMLVPDRFKASFVNLLDTYFQQPHKWNTGEGPDFYALHKNGTEIPVEIGLNPIKTEDHILVLSSVTDISQRKREELELREAKEKAEKLSYARQEFLSVMSHEMRTPLNAVVGISHLLAEGDLTEEQRENINILQFSTQNLLGLINNILDFSKIEAGKLEIESVDMNVNNLGRHLVESFRHHAQEKQIELKFETDFYLQSDLVGDPGRLTQVLTNLIHNALKFTDKGSVTLSITTIRTTHEKVSLRFSIADTGMGIEEDRLEEIFDSYTQAKPSITRQFGGTGLGLTICKKLAHLMGGEIKVESQVGEGSVFTLELEFPVSKTKRKSTGQQQHHYDFNLSGLKVLLVEDNVINQVIARKFLTRWNTVVDTAENGLEAVRKVSENEYDIILMDLQMPLMDGYKANRIIREMGYTGEKLPVIAISAYAIEEIKAKVIENGMNDYISKPFDPIELYKVISKYSKKGGSGFKDEMTLPGHIPEESFDLKYLIEGFDDKLRKEFLELQQKEVLEFIPMIKVSGSRRNADEVYTLKHKITPSLKRLNKQALLGILSDLIDLIKSNANDEVIEAQLERACNECYSILDEVKMLEAKYSA